MKTFSSPNASNHMDNMALVVTCEMFIKKD